MLNITRATTHILGYIKCTPSRQNVEGTIFRGYMEPRKFRQLSIVKAQSRPWFPIHCLKVILKTQPEQIWEGLPFT